MQRPARRPPISATSAPPTGRLSSPTVEDFSKTLAVSYVEEFPGRRKLHMARIIDFRTGQAVGIRTIDVNSALVPFWFQRRRTEDDTA
jgi:hypothetical protein